MIRCEKCGRVHNIKDFKIDSFISSVASDVITIIKQCDCGKCLVYEVRGDLLDGW